MANGIICRYNYMAKTKKRVDPLIVQENGQVHLEHLLIMDLNHPFAKVWVLWSKVLRAVKRFRIRHFGYEGCECH